MSSPPAPRSGATASTTTSRRLNQPDVPPDTASLVRLYAPPPVDRPRAVRRRHDPDARRRPAWRAHRGVRRRPSCASGCGSSRCCSCSPRPRARASARALLDARRAARRPGHGPRDRHRQRPADQQRAVRLARDRAARAAAQPHRDADRPEAFGSLPSGVDAGPLRASWPAPATAAIASSPDRRRARSRARSAWPTRSTTATSGQESRRGWLYRGPDDAVAGLRLRQRGRPGRAGRRPRPGPARPRPRPPHERGVSRAAPSRCGCRGPPTAPSCPRCAPGFRLDQFPVLLCWDRPFADLDRYLPISPGLL